MASLSYGLLSLFLAFVVSARFLGFGYSGVHAVASKADLDRLKESHEIVALFLWSKMCSECTTFAPKFEAVAQNLDGKVPVKFASLEAPLEVQNEDEKWFDFAHANSKRVLVYKRGKLIKELPNYADETAIEASVKNLFAPHGGACTEDLECISQACRAGRCREAPGFTGPQPSWSMSWLTTPFSASSASILLGLATLLAAAGVLLRRRRLKPSSSTGSEAAIQGSRVHPQGLAQPPPRSPPPHSPPPVMSGGARQPEAGGGQEAGRINGYQVIKKLGQGGFGAAFMVHDRHGEKCVLKTVNAQSIKAANEALVEVKQLCVLDHPNIVRYKDFFLHMKGVCIVMEFCEGGDLCDVLQSGRKISEDSLLKWTGEMCRAMSYIHDRNIIHRDLKPDNIFISGGSIRIADFGLSRVMPKLKGEEWWTIVAPPKYTMSICGTDLYMAPEVLNEEPYGKEADVWSLGVVILELGMGSLLDDTPSGKTRAAHLEELISNKVRRDLICLNPLRSLIRNMLNGDPAERPSMARVIKNPLISTFGRKARKGPLKKSATDISHIGRSHSRSRRPLRRAAGLEAALEQKKRFQPPTAIATMEPTQRKPSVRKRKKSSGSGRRSSKRKK